MEKNLFNIRNINYPSYTLSVQSAWFGNQLAVQFFVLSAPTILKARHAPEGTLALFASLSLLWCLRGVAIPPLIALLPREKLPIMLMGLVLIFRFIIISVFIILSLISIHMTDVNSLRYLLLFCGAIVCTISGFERGLLEAASVLASDFSHRSNALHISLSASTGIVLAWLICNGLILPSADIFGITAAIMITTIAVFGFSLPVLLSMLGKLAEPVRKGHYFTSNLTRRAMPLKLNCPERAPFAPPLTSTIKLTLVLTFGWISMDLAWRIAQPLMVQEGVTLTTAGIVGFGSSILLLTFSVFIWLGATNKPEAGSKLRKKTEFFGAVGIFLLSTSGFSGGITFAISGYVILQLAYFCFNLFTTEFLISHGYQHQSPGMIVSASAIAYFAAHLLVVPILYFSSWIPHSYGVIAVISGMSLLLWRFGINKVSMAK